MQDLKTTDEILYEAVHLLPCLYNKKINDKKKVVVNNPWEEVVTKT